MEKEQLFNRNYILLCIANFLFFASFYLLLPVLPFYLNEVFGVSQTMAGFIISCYTIATLFIRFFSGYIMDAYARKPVYLLGFAIFTVVFCGYIFAATVLMLIFLRIIHGLSYGMTSVSSNTLVIDVMPSSRRGEGLGYFGVANNIAMALGPMAGLLLYSRFCAQVIFITCTVISLVGMLIASQIKTRQRPPVKRLPVSLDRFILLKGLPAGLSFVFIGFAYGQITNYIALYAQKMHLSISGGMFFLVYAIGLIMSRLFSGRMTDKGKAPQVISIGFGIVLVFMFMLFYCSKLSIVNLPLTNFLFILIAFGCGFGFGSTFPAFNSLFISLAPANQRGAATSTYLTSWDVGFGIGIFTGGAIADKFSFSVAYLVSDIMIFASMIYFIIYVKPHFIRNKLN
jgi:MFS family permease